MLSDIGGWFNKTFQSNQIKSPQQQPTFMDRVKQIITGAGNVIQQQQIRNVQQTAQGLGQWKELGTQALEFGAGAILPEQRQQFRQLPVRRQVGEAFSGTLAAAMPLSFGGAIPRFRFNPKGALLGGGMGAGIEYLRQEKPTLKSTVLSPSALLFAALGGIHGGPIIKELEKAKFQNRLGFIKIPGMEKMTPQEYKSNVKAKLITAFNREPPVTDSRITGSKEIRANFVSLKKEFTKNQDVFVDKYVPYPKKLQPSVPKVEGGVGGVPPIKIKGQEPIKIVGGGEGGIPPPKVPPTTPPISDQDLITRLTTLIKEAKPLRGLQEELYTKAKGEKLAKLISVREKMAGEKGFYEELGALKGELPKVQYEPVRQEFNQQNVDRLFNIVKENKVLNEWEKVNAQVGLQKILGEKGGGVPTKGELEKLYNVFGKEFTETLLSKRPFFEQLSEVGMQLYNLPRSMMAGVGDFSATLMQNILFAYRHPIMTVKNFVNQVKMFGSELYYKASGEEIAQRSNYELFKKAKISFTDVGPLMRQREEVFMASWAERIPGLGRLVRATGRAWTGFLNRMRADVGDQLVNNYRELGGDVNDPRFLESLGSFVNAGTGRGNLGQLERAAPILAQGMFSARKLLGVFQMINPVWYVKANPFIRQEALKTMAAFVGGGMTIISLAKLAGAEVEDEPTNADYGKIKIGNTRLNVWGTYQQMAVLIARLYKGYATSSTTGKRITIGEGYKPTTRLDLITRFFESKEHPTLSLIFSALRGQDFIGQPFNLPSEVLNRFIPMVLGDSYDLYKEHGPIGLLGTIPAILGVPTQTYGKQYPTIETTPTGKPTIKLKPETRLEEDIFYKITGQQKSNIPQEQWQEITQIKQAESIEKYEKEKVKADALKGNLKPQGNYVPIIEDGEIVVIDKSWIPKKPTLTGDYETDKDAVSEYKSDLKKKLKNDKLLEEHGYTIEKQIQTETDGINPLIKKYFPQDQWNNAQAVMIGESGGDSTAHNYNPSTGDDSYGLFQINLLGELARSRPPPEQLLDPEFNVKYAAQMYAQQGWRPWTVAQNLGIVGGGQVSSSVLAEMNRKKQVSQVNEQMNFVYDALDLGLMSEEEAIAKLNQLDTLKKSLAKAKKPKKVTFARISIPSVPQVSNIRVKKLPTIKMPKQPKRLTLKKKTSSIKIKA